MRVTIITVNYNNGAILRNTLESVAAQSYPDIEHVIVDGGSTDQSLDIIREHDSRYPKLVRWISEPDNGVYNAINKGIEIATGDVIGVLHGNDVYVGRDTIASVVAELERHPEAPYVYGDVHYFTSSGKCTRLYSGPTNLSRSLRIGMAPPHPSLFIRKSVVAEVGTYDESYRIAADFEYFIRLVFRHGLTGIYMPLDMVGMSIGGLSTRLRNRLFTNNIEKMRALRRHGVSRTGLSALERYIFTPFQ